MRTSDFSPLWRSTVGYDHVVGLLEASLRQSAENNYPPFDIERSGDDAYRVSLAVAGFGVGDVAVSAEQNTLIIEGKKPAVSPRDYLYQGIAARSFRRVFKLADHVRIKEASFQHGLLVIDLVREVPDAMKPRRIPIGVAGFSRQIEHKQAA